MVFDRLKHGRIRSLAIGFFEFVRARFLLNSKNSMSENHLHSETKFLSHVFCHETRSVVSLSERYSNFLIFKRKKKSIGAGQP